jgi:hypothetical protein
MSSTNQFSVFCEDTAVAESKQKTIDSEEPVEYYSTHDKALRLLFHLKGGGYIQRVRIARRDKSGKIIHKGDKIQWEFINSYTILVGSNSGKVQYPTDTLRQILNFFEKLEESGIIYRSSSNSAYKTPRFGWCHECDSGAHKHPHNVRVKDQCFSSHKRASEFFEAMKLENDQALSRGFEYLPNGTRSVANEVPNVVSNEAPPLPVTPQKQKGVQPKTPSAPVKPRYHNNMILPGFQVGKALMWNLHTGQLEWQLVMIPPIYV